MTARRLALALGVAALAACNGDHAPPKSAAPTNPSANGSAAAPALPADQQCLPLNVCFQWSGCALVAKAPKFWTVITADRFAPGDLVDVTNVCSGTPCIAVRGIPKGVDCPDLTTPIYIASPGYRCVWDGKTCHRA